MKLHDAWVVGEILLFSVVTDWYRAFFREIEIERERERKKEREREGERDGVYNSLTLRLYVDY